jgi:redox-sensitive bicupin YhaK (pirin superfamily)
MSVLGAVDTLELAVPAGNAGKTQVLLLGGVPLNEPVVQHGPFVMNTSAIVITSRGGWV